MLYNEKMIIKKFDKKQLVIETAKQKQTKRGWTKRSFEIGQIITEAHISQAMQRSQKVTLARGSVHHFVRRKTSIEKRVKQGLAWVKFFYVRSLTFHTIKEVEKNLRFKRALVGMIFTELKSTMPSSDKGSPGMEWNWRYGSRNVQKWDRKINYVCMGRVL